MPVSSHTSGSDDPPPIGATLRIDAWSDTLVSPVIGAALAVVALETGVIDIPIPCYLKRESSAA